MSIVLSQREIGKMKLIGQGAEAAVYREGEKALKIFKEKVRSEKKSKIEYMVAKKIEVENVLYPQEKIIDENSNFLGYSMPFCECWGTLADFFNKPLYLLPTYSLILTAINLCDLYGELHNLGIPIGDGNPKNFLVPSNLSCIYLADADSIQLKGYKCNVGMPDYLSPEIQASLVKFNGNIASLPDGTFTIENDRFSLCCLVFQILMNGSHPFSYGKKNGNESSSVTVVKPSYGILRRKSAYFVNGVGVLSSDSLNVDEVLTPTLKAILRRGLLGEPDQRPTARELKNELKIYWNSLYKSSCGKHSVKNEYIEQCPYCELARKKKKIEEEKNENIKRITNCGPRLKDNQSPTAKNTATPAILNSPKTSYQVKTIGNTSGASANKNANVISNGASGSSNNSTYKYVKTENANSVAWGILSFILIAICEIAFFIGTSATDGMGIVVLVCCLIFNAISCILASLRGHLSGGGVFLLILINAIAVPIFYALIMILAVALQVLLAILIIAFVLAIISEL